MIDRDLVMFQVALEAGIGLAAHFRRVEGHVPESANGDGLPNIPDPKPLNCKIPDEGT